MKNSRKQKQSRRMTGNYEEEEKKKTNNSVREAFESSWFQGRTGVFWFQSENFCLGITWNQGRRGEKKKKTIKMCSVSMQIKIFLHV